jgi:hypothetical protein
MHLRASVAVWLSVSAGCAVDQSIDPNAESDAVVAQSVATRNPLERNLDAMLRANDGSGCDLEGGRQVCIVTTTVEPRRVLRIDDSIPSLATLSVCTGASCTIVTPPPPPKALHCSALIPCLPLAVGCVHGEMHCEPSRGPFGGRDLNCECNVLD